MNSKESPTLSEDSLLRTSAARLSDVSGVGVKRWLTIFASTGIIILTLGFMFATAPASSEMKIGYVDSATILNLLPAAQSVQAKLDTLVQDWSDTIDQMSKKYQKDVDNYERQSDLMSPQAKQRAQNQISDLEQEIISYRQARVGQGGELDKVRAQLLKPVTTRLYAAIARVARQDGLQYVLDKNDETAVVLYADPYYDITYKVMDLLTR